MNRLIMFIFYSLLSMPVFSQIRPTEEVYKEENLKISMWRDENPLGKFHIDLSSYYDKTLIKSFEIQDESLTVGAVHFGVRRIIALIGWRDYYLIDMDSLTISNPLRQTTRDEAGPHARIRGMRIDNQGKYLTFNFLSSEYWMDISNPIKPVEMLVVELDNAWVRAKPSDGEVIMKLAFGTFCKILAKDKQQTINGQTDYWYKITHNGKEGYIFGSQTSVNMKY